MPPRLSCHHRGWQPSFSLLGIHGLVALLVLLLIMTNEATAFSVKPTMTAAVAPSSSSSTETVTTTTAPATAPILSWEKDVEAHIRTHLAQQQEQDNDNNNNHNNNADSPYMIGVCGIPGSGKSTSALILSDSLQDVGACVFPADGYHFPKAALADFADPVDALYRRGAPDTFDAAALVRDLTAIRFGTSPTVNLPGFDHAVGDPVDDQHVFERARTHVVVCEGLYLLHPDDGWGAVKELFDMIVFVEADVDKAMARLKIRNRVIPGYTPEEIDIRVDAVDRANALMVERSKTRADMVVKSVAAAS